MVVKEDSQIYDKGGKYLLTQEVVVKKNMDLLNLTGDFSLDRESGEKRLMQPT